jgi:hypothetical protein
MVHYDYKVHPFSPQVALAGISTMTNHSFSIAFSYSDSST